MACDKTSKASVLGAFFDQGSYTSLSAQGGVEAAFGCAGGQPVYALFQNGQALSAKDAQTQIRILDLAAQTGNPVVTFYNSNGGKLEEGLALLKANAALTAKIGQISGVVPQIAVVLGVCAGTAALQAAGAALCVVSEEAEFFFTAPFTSAAAGDVVEGAGTAALAAKAGVAALVEKDTEAAVAAAARLAGLMPANNLAGPAILAPAEPAAWPAKYEADKALAALADGGSLIELYAGCGKNVTVALGAVNGSAAGLVATRSGKCLCHECVSKAARFVRLCDAFSIPVVTLVDCEGFVPSASDDLTGGIREASRLAFTYADATTGRVALLAGKALGPVYSALAQADLTIALPGSVTALADPRTLVTVLNKEELDASGSIEKATAALAGEYSAKQAGPEAALAAGCADFAADGKTVRATLVAALDMLSTKRARRLPKKHGNMSL